MSSWWQDIRFGARMLARNPWITAVIVMVLALGIGANTAIFSVVNPFLLRPLPYAEPERLVHLFQVDAAAGWDQVRLSLPQFLDWRSASESFSGLELYDYGARNLTGPGADPEQLITARLSAGMLPLLGVEPRRGRGFAAGEDAPGGSPVVILSDGLWQRRYGGREDLLGETVVLDGVGHTVVGVMAPNFHFPYPEVKMWVPLPLDGERYDRESRRFLPVGRLAAGTSIDQAGVELLTIHQRLAAEYPETDGRFDGPRLVPLRQALLFAYDVIRVLMALLVAAVGFVLMIVAANVANILLARAGARRAEVAIRTSLGAGRRRLVRQFLTESALLALLGGAPGAAVAVVGVRLIDAAMPEALYRVGRLEVDGLALVFTLGVSLAAALLFGLVPALRSTDLDLSEALKDTGRGAAGGLKGRRLRSLLVVAQISLAVVLLSSALSMVRSAAEIERLDLGFDPGNVLTLRLSLPSSKYPSSAEAGAFFDLLTRRLEALPGVEAASAVAPLPQSFSIYGIEFEIPGREPASPGERLGAHRITATPRYFDSLEIPLLSGRVFSDRDRADSDPVVVVNRAFVDRFWPGEDAVGRTLDIKESAGEAQRVTVVGVVGDVRDAPEWQGESSGPQVYLPWAHQPLRGGHLVLRGHRDPKALIAPVRAEIRRADADLPVSEVWTMDEVLAYSVSPLRIAAQLLGGFSLAAMLLAAVGIYAVVAYAVSRRRREFGVRLALGADRGSIVRLVLGQGAVLTALGVGLGLAAAIALGQLLASQMPSVGGFDGLTLAAVAAVLGLAALAASFLPARRASRLDPIRALRYE